MRLSALAAALNSYGSDVPMLFNFGQVDVEFVFNFERIKNEDFSFSIERFDAFCDVSATAYMDFIGANFIGRKVHIMGLLPPALVDDAWLKGYVNAHVVATESSQALDDVLDGAKNLEIPSLLERTRLHQRYNELLRMKACGHNFEFVDSLPHFLGKDDVLDPKFIPTHKGADHHLEEPPSIATAEGLIKRILNTAVHDCPQR